MLTQPSSPNHVIEEEIPLVHETHNQHNTETLDSHDTRDRRNRMWMLPCLILLTLLIAMVSFQGVAGSAQSLPSAPDDSPPPSSVLEAVVRTEHSRSNDESQNAWPCTLPSTSPITAPGRLAIYYGYPSLVNDCAGDVDCAAAAFCEFDLVVFGDTLEHPIHPDHEKTREIIERLHGCGARVYVYGYVDLGVTTQNLPLPIIKQYIDEWKEMGIDGIFLDNAGTDYGVPRERLCDVVEYIHSIGLFAFVNAWDPDDVLADDPPGTPTCLGEGDLYLAESHPVACDQCGGLDFWWTKSQKLLCYRQQTGVRMVAMSTGDDGSCADWLSHPPYRQALWAAHMFGFDFGFSNCLYSASGDGANRLCPLPSYPSDIGTVNLTLPTGPVSVSDVTTYWRLTDRGTIFVLDGDSSTCNGSFIFPSLSIEMEDDPSPVSAGEMLTYTLRVTNTSMVTLTAVITDYLPSQVSPSGVLTWTASIPRRSTWVQEQVVAIQPDYRGAMVNVAEVRSKEGASGSQTSVTVCVSDCVIFLPFVSQPCCIAGQTKEAEACLVNGMQCCSTEGFWEEWCTTGFSGGCLIHNELSPGQPADLSKLTLDFQGSRVCVVYRQDYWYGLLRVEIDDQVYRIDQSGPPKNEAEACYDVGPGYHSLTLIGSEDMGVITVDAVRIVEESP